MSLFSPPGSFLSVVNAAQLLGCICTFTCSAYPRAVALIDRDVFDDYSQLGLFAWKTVVNH